MGPRKIDPEDMWGQGGGGDGSRDQRKEGADIALMGGKIMGILRVRTHIHSH